MARVMGTMSVGPPASRHRQPARKPHRHRPPPQPSPSPRDPRLSPDSPRSSRREPRPQRRWPGDISGCWGQPSSRSGSSWPGGHHASGTGLGEAAGEHLRAVTGAGEEVSDSSSPPHAPQGSSVSVTAWVFFLCSAMAAGEMGVPARGPREQPCSVVVPSRAEGSAELPGSPSGGQVACGRAGLWAGSMAAQREVFLPERGCGEAQTRQRPCRGAAAVAEGT